MEDATHIRNMDNLDIPGYRVLEEIGRGGMAVVYKALQVSLGRYVALKVLNPYLAGDPELVKRFQREAKAAAVMRHPNIVTIYDVGEANGYYFIAMEYVKGKSLKEYLTEKGPLSPEEAIRILKDVASALDYAHKEGFVHRDVKPSNVLIDRSTGRALLADFGVVRALHEGTHLTHTGQFVGTVRYASPEQVTGRNVGYRSDLYSFGIMTYEVLAGHAPFEGDTLSVLHAQVYTSPPSIRRYRPEFSPKVDAVLAKMLSKSPSNRYPTASEFVADLRRTLSEKGVGKKSPLVSMQSPAMVATVGALVLLLVLFLSIMAYHLRKEKRGATVAVSPAFLPSATPAAFVTPLPQSIAGAHNTTATIVPTGTFVATSTTAPTGTSIAAVSPSVTPPPPTPYIEVVAEVANLRTGPSTKFSVVGKPRAGERMQVLGRNRDASWIEVRTSDGKTGWIYHSTVSLKNSPADFIRVVPTPTLPPLPLVEFAFVGAHPDKYAREIYALYVGDPRPHRLTFAEGSDGYPGISPDRKHIVFEAGRNGKKAGIDIWLMDSDGSNQKRLTTTDGNEAQPSFSPDGRHIVFISDMIGRTQIYVMDLDGRNVRRIPAPGWCFAPSFSPDGKDIVFVATKDSKVFDVFVIGTDGQHLRQVTHGFGHCENPSFTSDGRFIVFQSNVSGNGEIWKVRADGSGSPVNLTNNPADDSRPALSWDGKKIAFVRVTFTKPHIWLMNADGSNQHKWIDLGLLGEIDPAWSR